MPRLWLAVGLFFVPNLSWLADLSKQRIKEKKKKRKINYKDLTRSASGIRARFSPRRRGNALDLSIPKAHRKSLKVIVEGKRSLFGSMTSSSTLMNSLCTNSLTPIIVLNNWVPAKEIFSIYSIKFEPKIEMWLKIT